MKKHLVIVSTFFSPQIHVASNRITAFAKYLDKQAFDITVITLDEKQRNISLEEAKYGIKVVAIPARAKNESFRFTGKENYFSHKIKALGNKIYSRLFTDLNDEFTKKTLSEIKKIHAEHPIDILLTSYSPISPLLIGLLIKKEFPEICWISDLRDEFAKSLGVPFFLKSKLKILEAKMAEKADFVLSVSEPILNDFRVQASNKNKFLEIRNGYDFECIEELRRDFEPSTFKIAYTGTFYGVIKPDTFFTALESFRAQHPNIKIEFHIYGGNKGITTPSSLKDILIYHDKVPYHDIPRIISKMDALLIIHPTGLRKGVFTTKIFDYLAVNVPILAIVDRNDVAAKLIVECNSGVICDYHSPIEIASCLKEIYQLKKSGQVLEKNWDKVRQNHRKMQVQKLNNVLLSKFLKN